jgi:hypothetical protein
VRTRSLTPQGTRYRPDEKERTPGASRPDGRAAARKQSLRGADDDWTEPRGRVTPRLHTAIRDRVQAGSL